LQLIQNLFTALLIMEQLVLTLKYKDLLTGQPNTSYPDYQLDWLVKYKNDIKTEVFDLATQKIGAYKAGRVLTGTDVRRSELIPLLGKVIIYLHKDLPNKKQIGTLVALDECVTIIGAEFWNGQTRSTSFERDEIRAYISVAEALPRKT
jgi:hypothetical protein